MLDNETIKEIEEKIKYTFKNKSLLIQAFTRKSYAKEDRDKGGKGLSNEQLEFYGDKVLKYVIADELASNVATIDKECNLNSKSEEELSNFNDYWTDETMLSSKIQELDISKYLIVNESDKKGKVNQNLSVMEDLFESIIGAIWFDTDKNIIETTSIAEKLLGITFDAVCFNKTPYTKLKEYTDKYSKFKIESETRDNEYIFKLIGPDSSLSLSRSYCKDKKRTYHSIKVEFANEAIKFLNERGIWEDKK